MINQKTVDSEIYKIFQADIEKEILKGEITRAKFLSIIFLIITFFFSAFPFFRPEDYLKVFTDKLNPYYPPIFFISASTYFFINSQLFQRWSRLNKPVPIAPRYLDALIQTSLPSIPILYLGSIREPAIYVMLTPPVFVYFIFIIISALQLNFKLSVFTGLVAATEYFSITLYFHYKSMGMQTDFAISSIQSHIAKTVFMLVSGIIVGYVTLQIERRLLNSFKLLEERNRVTNIFGQHVSPAVVEKLLSQIEFTSEMRHVCMLFFDIRNFTQFSETKKPEEVVSYLNTIFDFSIDIINRNGGIINKFLGDGFMAVFGAPISSGDDIKNAVKASLEIIERVQLEVDNKNIPHTNVGIGLHSGDAVTGNVGSSKRKEYTIIGDVVNLASRIEQLNKSYSSMLLVSEDVWKGLSGYSGESLGEVLVKGREKPVRIYKLA
ncbi:MAG TPA: adenylate/guanylate cyclase domain-containing protein [Leptospiraceae bacterium]|nr:adenylate/guanylate cyclase domain-containing protein [Leptospiraceae bacterium]HRG77018.1 adenylate/guanylate cyclase domain-containing protein [Leptospiraceae bacterium]